MDEITARLVPHAARQPLTDASNRVNTKHHGWEYDERLETDQDEMKSPDRMSIVTSSISPRGNVDPNCLSPMGGSQTPSKRDSTVSAASTIMSGRGKRKTHVGPWQLGRTLGKGATGRVRLAKHAMTGQTAAIKIVSKKSAAMVQSESIAAMDKCAGHFGGGTARQMPCGIEREVVIMKLIEHANVISLYDVWENRGELYLVLEYVEGGELFDYVSNHGPLPEEEAVRLFRQIIAGLGFCHRFNICHRDLKPENILLDAWHNVKLADFGMAALQPAGHWLNTSCGSPHYAAPEIIYGRRYRGDRADIWSCGIILYALLTGYLPFDGGDLPNTLRLVKKGEYFIPPELSDESADLIQRILQKRPEDRISMQSIFMHPLLRKYEKLHQAMSKHYVGPPPPLSVQECGQIIASPQDIDIDILQNLQTLWHDVKPDVLVNRVLCLEPTQERMFYNALIRFRDEQLENYQGQPLEYSASDYHHISTPVRKQTPNSRMQHGSQRRTQFSVKKPTHRRVDSIKEPKSSGTVGSYDPFRSPRNVRIPDPDYAQVTIHRESSGLSNSTPAREIERPANPVARDDFEDEEAPSSPFSVVRNKKAKGTSVKSFHSKMSQASSRRGATTAHTPRSVSHKRNVSFHHIRHRSQGSAASRSKQAPPKQTGPRKQISQASLQMPTDTSVLSERHGSPGLPAQPTVVRGAGVTVKNAPQIKKVRDSDFIWRDEARQVSNELSKICEEAFNGSSMSTGCTTSACGGTETPDTSVSLASPENSQHHITAATKLVGRSLPDTPNSSAANLAETRRKLIEHSRSEGSDVVPAHISGVITQLDRLIEEDAARQCEKQDKDDLNSLPDPSLKSLGEAGHLPMISEEFNQSNENQNRATHEKSEQKANARSTGGSQLPSRNRGTIRMVPESSVRSIAEVKPLNIRKNGMGSASTEEQLAPGDSPTRLGRHGSFGSDRSTRLASAGSQNTCNPSGLDPIQEHPGSPKRSDAKGSGKGKWSWFPHKYGSRENVSRVPKEPRPIQPSTGTVIHHAVDRPEEDSQMPQPSQGTTSRKSSAESHIGGFFKKILRRKPSKAGVPEQPLPEPEPIEADSPLTPSKTNFPPSLPPPNDTQKPLPRRPRSTGKSQNWFARVFQLKPATRVVALNTSKIRGRKEIFRILREWKQYGLEDVYLDKTNSVIHGRVGEANFLRLRPVEFTAEFYTVLEHGRSANLSLVRFRQERGAASSFGKVVDSLNVVMKQRNLLVEDPARAKKMSRVLVDYPN